MEQTPKRILTALEKSGIVSGFRLTNLRYVARSLTEDCNLSGLSVDALAERLLVSLRTTRDYLAVFKHAHSYLSGTYNEKVIGKAKAKSFPYLGVYSLLLEPKPKRVVKTFKELGTLSLPTPVPPKPATRLRKKPPPVVLVEPPSELLPPLEPSLAPSITTLKALEAQLEAITQELEVERTLTEELQEQRKALTEQLDVAKDVVQRMLRVENMTRGICSLTFKSNQHLLSQAARYFENLVDIIGATSAVAIAEGLKLVSDNLDETGFPSSTIWQGTSWAKIVRTPEFKLEYLKLTPSGRAEIKDAIFHLSLNWRHPSLRSQKMAVNPIRVPDSAMYSRASDRIRFFWSITFAPPGSEQDKVLTLHRIDLKGKY